MRVSILGCGRWGSFLAWYLDRIGHEVYLWGREGSKKLEQLKNCRSNEYITLNDGIAVGSELNMALDAEVMIVSIAAQQLRPLMQRLKGLLSKDAALLLCMKGLEEETGKRLTQVVEDLTGGLIKTAVWVGPGHVQDFVNNIPNCMVIDSEDDDLKRFLADSFASELIRFYYGNDLIGNEIGAAAKNVIGIAAGMLDGLGYTSLKGALMSRGAREISRLIYAMGGDKMSAYGLAHLGDYEATVFSKYSHNRMFGELFVKNQKYGELAEGVSTTKALMHLSEQYHVDLPICRGVHKIINLGQDTNTTLSDLFLRSTKTEF